MRFDINVLRWSRSVKALPRLATRRQGSLAAGIAAAGALGLVLLAPALSRAQNSGLMPISASSPTNANVQEQIGPDGRPIEVVEMGTLTGAKEPDPALRYLFRPVPIVPEPGNAALHYVFAMQRHDQYRRFLTGDAANWDTIWLEMPVEELPVTEVEVFLDLNAQVFEAIDHAIACQYCDWQTDVYGEKSLTDLISLSLETHQQMRGLARLCTLETRMAIRQKDYDRATKSIRRMSRMAQDVTEPQLLITGLIGVAIQSIALGDCQTWIAQEGSPNLYWALTSLPERPIDLSDSMIGELRLLRYGIEAFNEPETRVWTREQWRQSLRRDFGNMLGLANHSNSDGASDGADAMITALAVRGYPIAKEKLIQDGFDPAELEAMPVLQVVSIYESRNSRRLIDNLAKDVFLDSQTRQIRMLESEELIKKSTAFFGDNPFDPSDSTMPQLTPLVGLLMPAFNQAMNADTRLQRNIAFLRTVEALRMHVATTGSIPESLDEITIVPVPKDPANGELFPYRVNDNSVELVFDAAPVPTKILRWSRP